MVVGTAALALRYLSSEKKSCQKAAAPQSSTNGIDNVVSLSKRFCKHHFGAPQNLSQTAETDNVLSIHLTSACLSLPPQWKDFITGFFSFFRNPNNFRQPHVRILLCSLLPRRQLRPQRGVRCKLRLQPHLPGK